ncbi:hypothetical protein CDD83_2566 [Cordyceps sp. RAO-2017]|nr:hypothetical protein CDD83_2566 [Cordyceps sp. RAO-2017]
MDDESDFSAIPVLDLAQARTPATKAAFLAELRHALVRVGFFYVRNHSIPDPVQAEALRQSVAFFALPLDKKLEMETVRSRHFLGYNRMDAEKTAARVDHNESIAIGPDLPAPGDDEPVYLNLQGPSQWPDEAAVPGFRPALERYRSAVQAVAAEFTVLIAEALELAPEALTRLFDDSPFSRLKVMMYPAPAAEAEQQQQQQQQQQQGAGAHKDGVFMTYLLQGGEHRCLEVQNKAGAWVAVPPVPGTLVVNIGRLLEALTRGVCVATTHRVVLRAAAFAGPDGRPLGPRLSLPFFQHVGLRLRPDDVRLDLPARVAALAPADAAVSDAESFFGGLFDGCAGDAVFVNMLTSYQDVARAWYPDLLPLALKKQADAQELDRQRLQPA